MPHHRTSALPPPDAEPPLGAAAALREIHRVSGQVRRVSRRWEVALWIAVAVSMPTFLLMQHLHFRQSTRIGIAMVALLLVGAVLMGRAGVVGRGAPRRDKLIGRSFVLLFAGANLALDWVPPGLSPWVVIVAIAPVLPPLIGAAWVLRR